MRTSDHYARDHELARLSPAERLPFQPEYWTAEADRYTCLSSGVGGTPIAVEANHGRWLVNCPCGGAQLTHPSDRRFMCVECGNADNGHQWRLVIWPPDWQEIEQVLRLRKTPWMNYIPGETAESLLAEHEIVALVGGMR